MLENVSAVRIRGRIPSSRTPRGRRRRGGASKPSGACKVRRWDAFSSVECDAPRACSESLSCLYMYPLQVYQNCESWDMAAAARPRSS